MNEGRSLAIDYNFFFFGLGFLSSGAFRVILTQIESVLDSHTYAKFTHASLEDLLVRTSIHSLSQTLVGVGVVLCIAVRHITLTFHLRLLRQALKQKQAP